jgi:hypothetical protein
MMREEWWVAGLYRDEFGYYRYDGEMDGATFSSALMRRRSQRWPGSALRPLRRGVALDL